MGLEYQQQGHWKELLLILEEHAHWFNVLVQGLFYHDEHDVSTLTHKPTSFAQWLTKINNTEEDNGYPEVIEKLAALHSEMLKLADGLVYMSKEVRAKPLYKDFQKFVAIYEEFLFYVRRLEKDSLEEGCGYDAFTGLRSKSLLYKDVGKEMDRLARQGKSFCLAMLKVDHFEFIKKNMQYEDANGYVKLIAGLIKLSVRSFDDAYYMGRDEFVLCLKQSDLSGGLSVLERLKAELEDQDIMLEVGGGLKAPMTMSCCISEPVNGDDVHDLIKNLRIDLMRSSREKKTDVIFEYREISQLERYAQEENPAD